jgi:hypothetical protein
MAPELLHGLRALEPQAVKMLDKLRRHLVTNELLLFDFPELADPQGRAQQRRRGGDHRRAAFATSGIDKVSLGARTRRRPA